jgi:hypothetical protein
MVMAFSSKKNIHKVPHSQQVCQPKIENLGPSEYKECHDSLHITGVIKIQNIGTMLCGFIPTGLSMLVGGHGN